MNTKNTSKSKNVDHRKKKTKKAEPEVFVLPPNLLEKLGIKLDKISSLENHSKNITDVPVNKSDNHQEDKEETYYVKTDTISNESESSILETASLMKESVLLSPTFVHTVANLIPGEVEIASVHKNSQNDNPIHGTENIKCSPVPTYSNQELINKLESGSTTHSDAFRNLQVHDKCLSETKDNCESNETPNIDCIDTDNIQNEQEGQQYLIKESQNTTMKINEHQENRKNKISILNDEIIDIAKISKFLSHENNNIFTPVTVGMLLPPTKAHNNILGSQGLNMHVSGSNQLQGKDPNFMDSKQCEYIEQACNDIVAHNTNSDIIQVLSKSNAGYDETSKEVTVYENKQFMDIELCVNIPNSTDASAATIATELNNDTGSEIISVDNNCLDNIQDLTSQDCPVVVQLVMSSEIGIDNQHNMTTDIEVKSQTNPNNIQEAHSKGKLDSFLDKNDVADQKICSVERDKHDCNDTSSISAANILPCSNNDTKNDSENGVRKSKLCIQGVEKPGGRSRRNREKVNKPKPDRKNIKPTDDKVLQSTEPVNYPQENLQVMKSLKTYQRKDKCNNMLTQNPKNRTNLSTKMCEDPENQIQDIDVDTICKNAEYCLCSDFGQLKYYDENNFYEHIHFWQHKNVACELDQIFSIYVDNIATKEYDYETTVEISEETSEESSNRICWNEICDKNEGVCKNIAKVNKSIVSEQLRLGSMEIEENDKKVNKDPISIDVEILKTDNNSIVKKYDMGTKGTFSNTIKDKDADKVRNLKEISETNKVTDKNKASKVTDANKVEDVNTKSGKKRKRSIRVSKEDEESSMDITEPVSKRDVKCGVCGQVLAKREWEEHSNKEHGCIAWKADENFDIEDKKVLIKINQKLKDDGVLKCTFCNFNTNLCAEYISHVKECIKNEMPCSFQVNTSTSGTKIKPKKTTRLSNSVKCGVCGLVVKSSDWIVHIRQEHSYIAWESEEPPLEVDDESQVIKHLRNIIIGHGALLCYKCKSDHLYGIRSIKSFLKHIELCNVVKDNSTLTDSSRKMKIATAINLTSPLKGKAVKCYDSPKRLRQKAATPSIEQNSVDCNAPKQSNIETGITLASPDKNKSLNKTDSNIGNISTSSAREEISLMHGDSYKIQNTATVLTPPLKGKTVKHDDSRKKINTETTSTHKKNTVETESPSIKSMKSGSLSKINVNNKTNLSLVKEKSVKCRTRSSEGDNNPSTPLVKDKAVKSINSSKEMDIDRPSTSAEKCCIVKCGVCKQEMKDNIWFDHVQKAHRYLAWKEGESSLDLQDYDQIRQHLYSISKRFDGLVCSKCGLIRKYVKAYLAHIKECDEMDDPTEADTSHNMDIDITNTVTSPIKEKINKRDSSQNIDIGNTLASSFKEKSVKCSDSPNKEDNSTIPIASSFKEKSVKCSDSPNKEDNSTTPTLTSLGEKLAVKCGVCKQEMEDSLWNDHMQKAHNYLAWKEDEIALDLEDKDQIWQHLHSISKKFDGLVCSKCGLNRKYVKPYLAHIKECEELDDPTEADTSHNMDIDITNTFTSPIKEKINKRDSSQNIDIGSTLASSFKEKSVKCSDSPNKEDNSTTPTLTSLGEKVAVKCGVCKQEMEDSLWNDHMQKAHNYLAWKEDEIALDLEDKDQTWQHLHSISKKFDGLVCSKCGLNRKYVKAYLNHTKQCDGTDDRTELDTSKNAEIEIATSTSPVNEINPICVDFSQEVNTESTLTPSHNEKEKTEKFWEVPIKVENDVEPTLISLAEKVDVKCGVCEEEIKNSDWNDHVHKVHNYLAWKEGESSIDLQDQDQVWQYLHSISKRCDGLVCPKCGLNRKYVKPYLNHIKQCDGSTSNNDSLLSSSIDTSCISEVNTSQSENVDLFVEIKCGVCSKSCLNKDWIMHIQSEHNYLAWKEGEPQLNLQDQEEIENHLRSIIKKHGSIFCWNCGIERKYGKRTINKFLQHVESCGKNENTEFPPKDLVVKCGVCEQDMDDTHWIKHIENDHDYLAWKHGEQPLDLEDSENVMLHFYKISKQVEAFRCPKCGIRKKYPKLYLRHIETCEATGSYDNSKLNDEGLAECGVCSEQMDPKEWRLHALEKHYNVAWMVGDDPIDIKSPYVAEKLLKEYKQEVGELVCNVCGISRVSAVGFYAHVLICGKSEEELEKVQNVCEICDKVYVCVYKNQHMKAHREQEYAKELKMQRLEKIKEENETKMTQETTEGEDYPVGRRRAAVKARGFIEKINIEEDDRKTCATCGFQAATAKTLASHHCVIVTFESGSDTEDSYESEESVEEDDSNLEPEVTEEEGEKDDYASKRRSHKESVVAARVPNVPFKYNKPNSYNKQSNQDFFQVHFTDEILFPEWLECKFEHLEESQLADYLPKIEQSCKIKLDAKWDTFNRFQVKKHNKGCSFFVGGTVKCLSWIPPRLDEDDQSGNYLAVSCHRDADTPRFNFDELSTHSGVIQIWDFGKLSSTLPKLVLCIAHDYGTVWAMDWCPSGARELNPSNKTFLRLGLLAVACSSGFVYIFSVPYPSSIAERDKNCFKLIPVAELRISMSSERKFVQATSVSWSQQKDHAIIIVGYADGTTALYDLYSTSPLLRSIEDGVTVYYPYHDRRDHNVCVTDVDICPSADVSRGGPMGAMCSTSMGGSSTLLQTRAGQPRLDGRSPATLCMFTPGWPSVMVAPDDSIATQSPNEMDWYGCGRRLGPARALSGCRHCGRVLVYTRPLLRYIDALPPYSDLKKLTVAMIKTTPLAKKRKIKNDKLAMLVEPLTYDDVITKYGIEVTIPEVNDRNSSSNIREPFTERFPLGDVAALAFCRAAVHHRLAAVGLHAGFVLIITV